MSNELLSNAIPLQYREGRWSAHILYSEDIRNPGKSIYGFAINAARLAAEQPLMLHCREDEIFEVMASLNELLGDPAVLGWACHQLARLQEVTQQKLARLTGQEEQPISEQKALEISRAVESYLTAEQPSLTAPDRLEEILTPNRLVTEKRGVQKMLARLERLIPAMEQVKDQGFHVVVYDRRRQPERPNLEARRNQPIHFEDQPTVIPAGFLYPPKYHLTLWTYLVVRSDAGQSTIWN
jgi:hypothetical protein